MDISGVRSGARPTWIEKEEEWTENAPVNPELSFSDTLTGNSSITRFSIHIWKQLQNLSY